MAKRTWTKAQKDAINAENGTLIVSAAAGSGKTSVLVERIVRKLTDPENPCPPGALLVVTFTNAAANEMRARIYQRLNELVKEGVDPQIVKKLTPRMDEMTVCTMDAFCIHLVRENFSACDVEADFGIIEEGEEKSLKQTVAREVIEGLYEEGSEDFLSLTRLFSGGRDDNSLLTGIIALSDFSLSEPDPERWLLGLTENYVPGPAKDSPWGKILCDYFLMAADYCLSLNEEAKRDIAENAALNEKLEGTFILIGDRLRAFTDAVINGSWDEIGQALSSLWGAASARFSAPRALTDDPDKKKAQAKKQEIKDVVGALFQEYPADEAEHTEDISALAPSARGLVNAVLEFNRRLLERKTERNRYGFSDIVHFAASLLYDEAAEDKKTALARTYAEGLSEILIDEYQDTNRVQDTVFHALSKNGENLFLVGDVKQSIYRFRLASPEIFMEKVESYPLYDRERPAKKAKLILGNNFRSRKGVTDLVNFVFSRLMSKELGEIEYNEDERLYPLASYPETHTPDVEFHIVADEEKKYSSYQNEANYIARLIEERIRSGLTVTDRDGARPAAYGDFCILLRSAKDIASLYADALRARHIPVMLDSKEGFFETAEIKMAVSMLRAIDNPLRDVDLLAFMLSPMGGFTPEGVAKIKSDAKEKLDRKKIPLWTALTMASEEDTAAKAFAETLLYYKKLSACIAAGEVIGRILDETPILAVASSLSEGYLRVANLRSLYEAALRFSSDGEKTLTSFIRYLETLEENGAGLKKGVSGGDKNSVTVLTMHRSKGLEYPFVIIAGLNKSFNLSDASNTLRISHAQGIGFKRREPEKLKFYETLSSRALKTALKKASLSEEMRIYYVALTRAREKLIFVSAPEKWEEKFRAPETLLSHAPAVPPFYSLGVSAPLQWLIAALLRHPDMALFRQTDMESTPADFRIKTVLANAVDPPEEGANEETAAPDTALAGEFKERMAQKYKYLPVSSALSLHTASHLRDEKFSSEFFGKSVPAFLQEKGLSPADIGTATHKFLQYCPFESAAPDIAGESEKLVRSGKLTPEEAGSVDQNSIKAFFSSPFFERILRADKVYKEQSFTIMKSVRDFDPSLPEEFGKELSVVIGKIDLVFIERGKAVIVDYKTDKVKRLNELSERYADQINLYSQAVEKVLGYPVKSRVLYSLTLRDFIEV